MKTSIIPYLLAFSTLLLLPCCKGNQEHNGQNVSQVSQEESSIETNRKHRDIDTLSFLVNSFEDIPSADLRWMNEIEKKFPTKDSLIIWFKYDCLVDDYQVTGRFSPVDPECETGQMIMRFDNGKNKFFYQSIWDDDYSTCIPIFFMVCNDSFKSWENKALYSLHYFKPEDDDLVDNTHPLGFYTPFQFFDINFDGKKELMISDAGMCKGGDMYYTYSIEGEQLKKIESLPIREVQTFSTIDIENKSITLFIQDGPIESVIEFKKGLVTKEPTFQYPPDWIGYDIYKEYKDTWQTNSFIISSIKLYDGDEIIDLQRDTFSCSRNR